MSKRKVLSIELVEEGDECYVQATIENWGRHPAGSPYEHEVVTTKFVWAPLVAGLAKQLASLVEQAGPNGFE
jgi:hypothetical protein